MQQPQNTKTAPDVEISELDMASAEEEVQLSAEEKAHLQLCENLLEAGVTLEVVPNRAMKWLIENTISPHPAYKFLLLFNYMQWIIMLPGLVALYFFGWQLGLAILAGCFLISVLVINPVKRWALRGGVREFVTQDLDYLENLYTIGAVRFRKGKKGRWIQHPRDWREVL